MYYILLGGAFCLYLGFFAWHRATLLFSFLAIIAPRTFIMTMSWIGLYNFAEVLQLFSEFSWLLDSIWLISCFCVGLCLGLFMLATRLGFTFRARPLFSLVHS